MKIINTGFKDLKIIAHKRHLDFRGNLRETYNKKIINWDKFIFEYATISKKNVLRGFHFQHKHQQSKLITVIKGKILDCVIDLRRNSSTFGKIFLQSCQKITVNLYMCLGDLHMLIFQYKK